jgi:hypothetical protein
VGLDLADRAVNGKDHDAKARFRVELDVGRGAARRAALAAWRIQIAMNIRPRPSWTKEGKEQQEGPERKVCHGSLRGVGVASDHPSKSLLRATLSTPGRGDKEDLPVHGSR